MADNYTAFDSAGSEVTLKTTETGGVHVGHSNVDLIAGKAPEFGAGAAGTDTLRVILASDSPGIGGGGGDATAANQVTMIASLGAAADAAVTNPASSGSVVALLKGLLTVIGTTLAGYLDGLEALIGTTNTTLTTIDGRVDGLEAQVGIVTETAPASDTASSGLNGRLQRIAQRITSLIALLPAALGPQTGAASLSVTPSTDQDPIFDIANGVKVTATTSSGTLITPGAGHKYLRVVADGDVIVNTINTPAVDDGDSGILIKANLPETIPISPSTVCTVLSLSGSVTVRATPLKVR